MDMDEEEEETITSVDQRRVEYDVMSAFNHFVFEADRVQGANAVKLDREKHAEFLKKAFLTIPRSFSGLDASRPWFVFWLGHPLELLGELDVAWFAPRAASFLSHCQDPNGGFAGGPKQLPHLAPTYAAVAALATAGTDEAFSIVNRPKLYEFLIRMKDPSGGFRMHDEGEIDMRGTYCAIATASMLRIITPELTEGVASYVCRCQNWEGGIAGEEDLEAHGGYSYCGLAALAILGEADKLNLRAFLHWAVHRQMPLEGGFQGRTNKLVDSCYSFWQGAVFPILHDVMQRDGIDVPEDHFWMAPEPLQMYVMLACQNPLGGLRDKPGKSPDFYHSCYSLSGIAAVQHGPGLQRNVVGQNELARTDIFYNIGLTKSYGLNFYDNEEFVVNGMRGVEGAGAIRWRHDLIQLRRARSAEFQ
uniref:Protein farnesyltransferase subunit beta n=1 Tax=Hematodinium sp. SG-2015 TaxID=1649283 RepID=A0A0F7C9G2_9DINO|nr:farnesyltransferase subunit beta [Hematodinium sp. SG-2015]